MSKAKSLEKNLLSGKEVFFTWLHRVFLGLGIFLVLYFVFGGNNNGFISDLSYVAGFLLFVGLIMIGYQINWTLFVKGEKAKLARKRLLWLFADVALVTFAYTIAKIIIDLVNIFK